MNFNLCAIILSEYPNNKNYSLLQYLDYVPDNYELRQYQFARIMFFRHAS